MIIFQNNFQDILKIRYHILMPVILVLKIQLLKIEILLFVVIGTIETLRVIFLILQEQMIIIAITNTVYRINFG